ncbi:MAG: gliding motility-associated C-terminal domain-containing protein [Saprospiraceae bacterium]
MRTTLTRFFLLCALFLGCQFALFGQSATVRIPNIAGDAGVAVCIPITVEDFTQQVAIGFTIQWPVDGATFAGVQNFNPGVTGLDLADFDLSNTTDGFLSLLWTSYGNNTCGSGSPQISLGEEQEVLFELCLIPTGTYASVIPVEFTNTPQPLLISRVLPNGTCSGVTPGATQDVLGVENGSITVGVRPLEMTVDVPEGNYQPGDLICVDIIAESGWDNLQAFQMGLDWNCNVLTLESIIPNTDIPNNTLGIFNNIAGCDLGVSWSFNIDGQSITLEDGTVFFQACFRITGACGSQSSIVIQDLPSGADLEAANSFGNSGAVIPIFTTSDRVRINNCNANGLKVVVDCGPPVNFGDQITIDILSGDNYIDILEAEYLVRWNPNLLEYVGFSNLNPGLQIENTDFILDNVTNGVLGFDYFVNFSKTRPAGTVLYTLTFNVIGLGSNAPIIISDPSKAVATAGSPNTPLFGINPTNCDVNIIQPATVNLFFGTGEAATGGQVCLPVTVGNFDDVTRLDFSMQVENILFDFVSIQNQAFPGAVINSALTSATGLITYSYNGPPRNLADGAVLFEVCLTPKSTASPGECGDFQLVPTPLAPFASRADAPMTDVMITDIAGESCVLFPEGFGITAGDVTVPRDSSVCVPFTVESFDNITAANFSVNFNSSNLIYSGVVLAPGTPWTGLTIADHFNVANAGLGTIQVKWPVTGTNPTPVVIPDGTEVFSLCFQSQIEIDCFPIDLEKGPEPSASTSNGNGSILTVDGEVCVEDRLVVENIIVTPATCAETCNGELVFEVSGGSGDIIIQLAEPFMISNTLSFDDVCPGWAVYTIYNTGSPSFSLRDSVFVDFDMSDLPTADAGDDAQLGCGTGAFALVGGNGNQNPGDDYTWFRLENGNPINPSPGMVAADGTATFFAPDAGIFLLRVRNSNGCFAFDTVTVAPANIPDAIAGADTFLTCANNQMITLSGAGSSTDGLVTYLWEQIVGGDPIDTLGNTLSIDISEPGRYRLTVRYPQTQCQSTDEIIVSDQRDLPEINPPTTIPLSCDGNPITLDADYQGTATGIQFEWTDEDGTVLSTTELLQVNLLGTFTITASNPENGCSLTLTSTVIPSTEAPQVAITGETASLRCTSDTLQLNSEILMGDNGDLSYQWTSPDGGAFVIGQSNQPNPLVLGAGTYIVEVSNGVCSGLDTIVVTEPVLPVADAGSDSDINCQQMSITLDGSASASGAGITYQWSLAGSALPGATTPTFVTAPVAGSYSLRVSDTATGCVSRDTVIWMFPASTPIVQLVDTTQGLSCNNSTITVTAAVTPANPTYLIGWVFINAAGDTIPLTNPSLSLAVTEPGRYVIGVFDPATGCADTALTVVSGDSINPPFVTFSQPSLDLTCDPTGTVLDASQSSDGPEFEYEWSNIIDGEVPTDQGNDSLIVNTPGTYALTVTNTSNNCSASDTVVVVDTRQFYQIDTLPVIPLSCDNLETEIAVTISGDPADYSITWLRGGMNIPSPLGNSITVMQGGTYQILVLDNVTDCVSSATITVESSFDDLPEIVFDSTDVFSCTSQSVTIDASATSATPGDLTIAWTSLDGNTIMPPTGSLIVSVSGPGNYVLSITDAGGCSRSETVTVAADQDTPVADAGEDTEADCGETPLLDGSGSTNGPEFTYVWTALGNATILSGGETTAPTVSGPGTFELIVTNNENLCTDRDTVTVNLVGPPPAMLPANFSICGDSTSLTGNLPGGSTGLFTVIGAGATISNPAGPTTELTGIDNSVIAIWTLSATGCPQYSADTVTITTESAPEAEDDELVIEGNGGMGTIDVLANDLLGGISLTSVTIISPPGFGTATFLSAGLLSFEAGRGISGETTLTYEVCSTTCPDLCAQATVNISVDSDGETPTVYNAITPNGDGLNETFIFDILANNPVDEFPNNELTIFNRWGDILFEASPYNNDWAGTDKGGTPVPEGTYYYILRLNLGEGNIIRGDVTVIR